MLLSGVHATIAGVLAAMTIPLEKTPGAPDSTTSPLHRLEHALHPWVAFLIVPLFGFANAGVDLGGLTAEQIFAPLPLGIAIGLFLGKQIGIFGRSEEHTSELQSLMRISYSVFCLKKKK